jgi:hypothetical protein
VPGQLKHWTTLVALIILSHALPAQTALAITAEVARKCGDLADKAYPPRVPGNPAAGHLNGTPRDASGTILTNAWRTEERFLTVRLPKKRSDCGAANVAKLPDSQKARRKQKVLRATELLPQFRLPAKPLKCGNPCTNRATCRSGNHWLI